VAWLGFGRLVLGFAMFGLICYAWLSGFSMFGVVLLWLGFAMLGLALQGLPWFC
jgi:hypothetical protein